MIQQKIDEVKARLTRLDKMLTPDEKQLAQKELTVLLNNLSADIEKYVKRMKDLEEEMNSNAV